MAASNAGSSQRYVLYVNMDYTGEARYDSGSQRCLDLLSECRDVEVQHIDKILATGSELPAWLDGTPCVVDTLLSTAVKGTAACRLAEQIEAADLRVEELDTQDEHGSSVSEGSDVDHSRDDNPDPFSSPLGDIDPIKIDTSKVDENAVQAFLAKRGSNTPADPAAQQQQQQPPPPPPPPPPPQPPRNRHNDESADGSRRKTRGQKATARKLSPPRNDSIRKK